MKAARCYSSLAGWALALAITLPLPPSAFAGLPQLMLPPDALACDTNTGFSNPEGFNGNETEFGLATPAVNQIRSAAFGKAGQENSSVAEVGILFTPLMTFSGDATMENITYKGAPAEVATAESSRSRLSAVRTPLFRTGIAGRAVRGIWQESVAVRS